MTDGTQSPTQEQNKKQYDWLKGYQFTKGKSGNPGGRPKGSKSLKTFAREYLENLPDEEKIAFLSTLPPEIVWRMSEGNPRNDDKIELTIPTPILNALPINNSNKESSRDDKED